jgi:hypothetical protein
MMLDGVDGEIKTDVGRSGMTGGFFGAACAPGNPNRGSLGRFPGLHLPKPRMMSGQREKPEDVIEDLVGPRSR